MSQENIQIIYVFTVKLHFCGALRILDADEI